MADLDQDVAAFIATVDALAERSAARKRISQDVVDSRGTAARALERLQARERDQLLKQLARLVDALPASGIDS